MSKSKFLSAAKGGFGFVSPKVFYNRRERGRGKEREGREGRSTRHNRSRLLVLLPICQDRADFYSSEGGLS